MSDYCLAAESVTKSFNRKVIFSNVSFSLAARQSLVISGRNGSGKSTLMKVLAALSSPTSGKVLRSDNGAEIKEDVFFQYIGYVAPYLQLYEEFTAWENLDLLRKIREMGIPDDRLRMLLELVQLDHRRNDTVRTFSSGMKQRMKYACALLHEPVILMLDEPTANLDVAGRGIVQLIVEEQRKKGIVIVATNEPNEMEWCDHAINLDDKNGK